MKNCRRLYSKRTCARSLALAAAATLTACAAVEPPSGEDDWAALARADIEEMHEAIAQNHPGPVDALNPEFTTQMRNARRNALRLARRANTPSGYRSALRFYVASYNDNHLGVIPQVAADYSHWPNFVAARAPDMSVRIFAPEGPMAKFHGATIQSCDGRTPDDLMEENVFPYRGYRDLGIFKITRAPYLFLDDGNPFVKIPQICRFQLSDGRQIDHQLEWNEIKNNGWAKGANEVLGFAEQFTSGVRRFGDNSFWINLPEFSPNDENRASVEGLIAKLEEMRDVLRGADAIVFDMRGNNGGSSYWGDAAINAIWGEDFVRAVVPTTETYVDWRVSDGNIAHLESILERVRQESIDPDLEENLIALIAGMRSAREAGEALYKESYNEASSNETGNAGGANPVAGKIILLTISPCSSACLDFADTLLALPNVTHAGYPTGADSVYMELREIELSSGKARMGLPTKVYRGRVRGHLEAYEPDWRYDGETLSTEALQNWVLERLKTQAAEM